MKKTTLIITTLLALNISHNANSEPEKSTPASAAETASTARARLADFSDRALSVEIFSFVSTRDYAEFTAIREDLMLQIMDIVTQAGTGFAFPSRTVYLGKRTDLKPELIEAAVQKIRQWRNEQKLPFPDFSPQEIAEMSNSAPYPSSGLAFNIGDGKKIDLAFYIENYKNKDYMQGDCVYFFICQ